LKFIANSAIITTVDMYTINERLGANIRKMREDKGLLQKEFSKKVGLDPAYLSNIETGKMNPTVTTIEKIAISLGVKVDELMK